MFSLGSDCTLSLLFMHPGVPVELCCCSVSFTVPPGLREKFAAGSVVRLHAARKACESPLLSDSEEGEGVSSTSTEQEQESLL